MQLAPEEGVAFARAKRLDTAKEAWQVGLAVRRLLWRNSFKVVGSAALWEFFSSRLIIPPGYASVKESKGFSCDYREVCAIKWTSPKCEFLVLYFCSRHVLRKGSKSSSSVAEGEFGDGIKLSHGFAKVRQVKERVVAEAFGSARS